VRYDIECLTVDRRRVFGRIERSHLSLVVPMYEITPFERELDSYNPCLVPGASSSCLIDTAASTMLFCKEMKCTSKMDRIKAVLAQVDTWCSGEKIGNADRSSGKARAKIEAI
jgi:hypothetical protein